MFVAFVHHCEDRSSIFVMNLVVGLPRLEKDWGKTNSINAAKKKKKMKEKRITSPMMFITARK